MRGLLFMVLGILLGNLLVAQQPHQRSRGISMAADLPRIHIHPLAYPTASDYSSLEVLSADSTDIQVLIFRWFRQTDPVLRRQVELVPGLQRINLCLLGIKPGPYVVTVMLKEKIISHQSLLIER